MSTAPFTAAPKPLCDDALQALQSACTRLGTQARVAEELGVSQSAVSQLLKGSYRGDAASMEQRIRGVFLRATVRCPVMGELSTKHCIEYQRQKLVYTNPLRVRMARACTSCHNRQDTPASTTPGADKC